MASNLLDMFHDTVGDLFAKQASGIFGESTESTTSALDTIVPSLLGILIQKGNTDAGASEILGYLAENQIDGSILTNVSTMLGGGIETEKLMYNGAGILRYLLDDNLSPLVDLVSGSSGLKTSSATSMLKLAAPLVMGIIGKQVKEKSLDIPGLKNLLAGQSEFVKAALPANIGHLMRLGAVSPAFVPASVSSSNPTGATPDQSNLSKLLPWLVLGLTALALFYFVQKGCGPFTGKDPGDTEAPKDTVTTAPSAPSNPTKTYTLPDGVQLSAMPGSFTAAMADFLAGGEAGEKCLAFDNVNFENGSFKIAAGSEKQLGQLAILLKAYPKVNVRIEGHTDNAGDEGKNKTLSKERTRVIKTWLTDQGVQAGRIDTKGLGGDKPIASNETENGREQNRRVEVCISKK